MRSNHLPGVALSLSLCISVCAVRGAELSVSSLSIASGDAAAVVVSGSVANESTFGVTVVLEIVPRAGAEGTVQFTPAPPTDIVQLGDPWPAAGNFMEYDTDITGALTVNGSWDDDGNWVPAPTTFSGPLASFPVVASAHAAGVWDVRLSAPDAESFWEGLPTTLTAGTITVTSTADIPAVSTWGLAVIALVLLTAGTLRVLDKPAGSDCGV